MAHRMKRLAVVIGIDDYPAPQSRLRGCVGDALRVGRFLYSARGGSFEKVRVLKNRDATLGRLRATFSEAASTPWDQVVVYFSGHGSHEGFLARDGLMGFGELACWIRSIRAQWPLLILDACQAGAVHPHFGGIAGVPAEADSVSIYLDLLRRAHPGLRVLTSVDRQTNALERNGQGVFTKALLEAACSVGPDLRAQGVSAARVFDRATEILYRDGDPLPQASGMLHDLPMALSDKLQPLGGVGVHQEPMQLVSLWGRPVSARFDFTVRIIGRRGVPTLVRHVLHDGVALLHSEDPLRVMPATHDYQRSLDVEVPLGKLLTGRELQSVVMVMDEHNRQLEQDRRSHKSLPRIPRVAPSVVRVQRPW